MLPVFKMLADPDGWKTCFDIPGMKMERRGVECMRATMELDLDFEHTVRMLTTFSEERLQWDHGASGVHFTQMQVIEEFEPGDAMVAVSMKVTGLAKLVCYFLPENTLRMLCRVVGQQEAYRKSSAYAEIELERSK